MADYYLRLYRKYPNKRIEQYVIYLLPSQDPLVQQNQFKQPQFQHQFNVIRLWEQPSEIFLEQQGLMPLAVLASSSDPVNTLRQIADKIEQLPEREQQQNLTAATEIISGLALGKGIIEQLLRNDIMKESVIYQAILAEGEQKGEQRGLIKGEQLGRAKGEQQGMLKEKQQIAKNMLQSGLAKTMIVELTGLTLAEVKALTEN